MPIFKGKNRKAHHKHLIVAEKKEHEEGTIVLDDFSSSDSEFAEELETEVEDTDDWLKELAEKLEVTECTCSVPTLVKKGCTCGAFKAENEHKNG